jgi:glycosyltransferase involved in cell wall biosynthesis
MNRAGGLYVGELAPHAALRAKAMARAAYLVLTPHHDADAARMMAEAFAHALPVIAPREGACAELVEPGRNGLLYEPGSPRELARRVAWAEAFPERMRQMGECAKADYLARLATHWSYPSLFGERRRAARAAG